MARPLAAKTISQTESCERYLLYRERYGEHLNRTQLRSIRAGNAEHERFDRIARRYLKSSFVPRLTLVLQIATAIMLVGDLALFLAKPEALTAEFARWMAWPVEMVRAASPTPFVVFGIVEIAILYGILRWDRGSEDS